MNTDRTRGTSWRVFCAFELPESLRARIEKHCRRLREAVPAATASWSRPESVHLTMKFFGNVDQAKVPAISKVLARVVKEFSPLEIVVRGPGAFGKQTHTHVLWIGIDGPVRALTKLQRRLEDECAPLGFPKEERAFRPHLTIARIRRPENARQLADAHLRMKFVPTDVLLDELILFRSELGPSGSKYTLLSRHRLQH
jgi:RNA 2',3'-cyclic 3'-phosphodiesterase